ncbi:pirin family protein [Spirulina major]|uniref:pirin family protein n=1 Tax=Spirulina major TaxID=270636 RepID=UPI0009320BF3|nr:pirin family protein [Spirulina major]
MTIIPPHIQDLGGFAVRRLLPNAAVSMIGPFIFFDHIGPADFPPGHGVDVRPHPHINLATVTYLFAGSILHRDSLGTVQEIWPGAVNWMTAGRGIVHSERSPASERALESQLHGIQTWIALPDADEEAPPSFSHHPATTIPTWTADGVTAVLIAGTYGGQTSPVPVFSPLVYLDLQFTPGGRFTLKPEGSDRALYSVTPGLSVDGQPLAHHHLLVLDSGQAVEITATAPARCLVIGGEPLGVRHKWWNFVSSRRDRIEQAKRDWVAGNFDPVPGETEFIPLPAD